MVSVPVLLAAIGGYFWLTGGRYVDTDNAYVQQAKVAISPDVAGRIITVAVHENQVVAAGDMLFTIDAEPYRIALAQADAALATARVNVEQLRVAYGVSQRASSIAANATLAIRQAEFDRKQGLADKGLAADATLDDIKLALQQAADRRDAGAAAMSPIPPPRSAAIRISRPRIIPRSRRRWRPATPPRAISTRPPSSRRPPASSARSRASMSASSFTTGTTIASLVETDDTWIDGQLQGNAARDARRSGMPVEIKVDAYPGRHLRGPPRVDRRGDRRGVRADPGAERHRQLGQGHPAHSGAHLGRGRSTSPIFAPA